MAEQFWVLSRLYGAYATAASTQAEVLEGCGTGSPSSCKPSRWKAIASSIFFAVSSLVAPVVTQPGTSGEYAENPVAVGSMTTKYFMV